jgi:hypothetical protein
MQRDYLTNLFRRTQQNEDIICYNSRLSKVLAISSIILCLPFCHQRKNYLFTSISAAVRKIFSYTENCTVVVMMAGVAFCA